MSKNSPTYRLSVPLTKEIIMPLPKGSLTEEVHRCLHNKDLTKELLLNLLNVDPTKEILRSLLMELILPMSLEQSITLLKDLATLLWVKCRFLLQDTLLGLLDQPQVITLLLQEILCLLSRLRLFLTIILPNSRNLNNSSPSNSSRSNSSLSNSSLSSSSLTHLNRRLNHSLLFSLNHSLLFSLNHSLLFSLNLNLSLSLSPNHSQILRQWCPKILALKLELRVPSSLTLTSLPSNSLSSEMLEAQTQLNNNVLQRTSLGKDSQRYIPKVSRSSTPILNPLTSTKTNLETVTSSQLPLPLPRTLIELSVFSRPNKSPQRESITSTFSLRVSGEK